MIAAFPFPFTTECTATVRDLRPHAPTCSHPPAQLRYRAITKSSSINHMPPPHCFLSQPFRPSIIETLSCAPLRYATDHTYSLPLPGPCSRWSGSLDIVYASTTLYTTAGGWLAPRPYPSRAPPTAGHLYAVQLNPALICRTSSLLCHLFPAPPNTRALLLAQAQAQAQASPCPPPQSTEPIWLARVLTRVLSSLQF